MKSRILGASKRGRNCSKGVLLVWTLLFGAICASAAYADESLNTTRHADSEFVARTASPYCGLECLYAALRYQGESLEFSSLLKPEYLGSAQGSSLAELCRAARDAGFTAIPVENLSDGFLRDLKCPLILHVNSAYNSRMYDHYVLCLRATPEGVRVLDAPSAIQTESFQSVLNRSDGIGLLISREPDMGDKISHSKQRRVAIIGIATFIGCICAGWFTWSKNLTSRPSGPSSILRSSLRQAILLALGAVSIGLSANTLRGDGLMAAGTQDLLSTARTPVEIVDKNQVRELLATRSAIIVDARKRADFVAGHIPGAINIPVDSEDSDREELLRAIPLNQPIVVYCQSNGCPYSDLVIAGLRSDGHRQLSVYRGGWMDWSAASTNLASH